MAREVLTSLREKGVLSKLESLGWKERFRTTYAIHGRHAVVLAVGASYERNQLVGCRVGKDTFTGWPLSVQFGESEYHLVFVAYRFDEQRRCTGWFAEDLPNFVGLLDMPWIPFGVREYAYLAQGEYLLRTEQIISGVEILPGVRTSYRFRMLEGLGLSL